MPAGFKAACAAVGAALGMAGAAVVIGGVGGTDSDSTGAAGDGRPDLPPPGEVAAVQIPLGTVWSEEAAYRGALGTVAARAFGLRAGRLLQRRRSVCRISPMPALPANRSSAPCW